MNSIAAWCRTFSFLPIALVAVVPNLRAELIASDDFEYESTLIRGCNGGFGWLDSWTGGNLVTVGSLRLPDREAKGHKLTTNGGTVDSIRCSFRTIDTSGRVHLLLNGKLGKPGTKVWVGFLANVPTGRNGGFGGLSLCNDRREQTFFGDTGGKIFWGIEHKKEQFVSTVVADEKLVFLAYRLTFRDQNTQIEMWIDPALGVEEPSVADVAVAIDTEPFQFNGIRVCSNPVPLSLDGLRFGTTYADIVPPLEKSPETKKK
jgi:hypothetical protein